MKIFKNVIICAVVFAACLGLFALRPTPAKASAVPEIRASADFYAPLTPCGAWIDVGGYGRCFRPAGVAVDWQPYCEGDWVWTDCGWYWESDEPWAWACYHYGTWVDDPTYGWIWLPGLEWAPAWVEWRVGGGYIGWAPCGPRGVVVAPALFAFVDVNRFNDPIRRTALAFNNETILRQTIPLAAPRRETRNINGVAQTVMVNHGPGVEGVEKATGHQLMAVPVGDEIQRTPVPQSLRPVEQNTKPAAEPAVPARSLAPDNAAPSSRDTENVSPEHPTPPVFPPTPPAAHQGANPDSGRAVPRHDDNGGRQNNGGEQHRNDDGHGRGGGF